MNPSTYLNEPISPRVTMSAYYDNRKVTDGCELHTLTAQTTPRVVIGGKHDEKYTLILADSDDPNYDEELTQESLSWFLSLSLTHTHISTQLFYFWTLF